MLEASNPESVSKSKKNKNNRPTAVNRFWPDNLAQGQITNNFKSSNSDDCESPPPGGQHVNSSGGEGGNSTNNNNVSPSNRSGSTPQDGMLLNGSRENAMNNCKLLIDTIFSIEKKFFKKVDLKCNHLVAPQKAFIAAE